MNRLTVMYFRYLKNFKVFSCVLIQRRRKISSIQLGIKAALFVAIFDFYIKAMNYVNLYTSKKAQPSIVEKQYTFFLIPELFD